MSYMALYRKFRPQTFEQVKGQDHVVRTLRNQIRNNRIGHAYLFTGTRGTGKTSVAKLFARAINCLSPVDGDPCNKCEACLAAARDSFMDIVEVDAASNTSVDDIRRIIEEVQYTPVSGRYKVYIIDEAHMLSGSAFNAFLKTLEEPPAYAVFILATTEPHKLPITILSRCQRYDFHRISNETIADNLAGLIRQEGVEAEDKALQYIARMGDGSMRDSISLLDKCIAFNLGEKLTYENVLQTLGAVDTEVFSRVFRAVLSGNVTAALGELESAVNEGKDITQFINDLIWYFRNLLIANVSSGAADDLLGLSKENLQTLKEDARLADPETLMRYIRIQSELVNDIRFSPVKQILTEVSFIRMARPQMESDTASLADRVRQLEGGRAPRQTDMLRQAAVPAAPETPVQTPVQERMPEVPWHAEPDAQYTVPQQQTQQSGPQVMAQPSGQQDLRNISASPASGDSVSACWPDIVSSCDSSILRIALRKSAPQDDEGGVSVFAANDLNYNTIREHIRDVEELIRKVTGREISVAVRKESERGSVSAGGKSRQSDPGFPEELMRKNIKFDIGTEEY